MTKQTSHTVRASRVCAVASLTLLATLGAAREAHASSDYPPALKAALDKEFPGHDHCVPLCTACHNTTQGGPVNINPFGKSLENKYGLLPGNPALVEIAIEGLKAASPPDDTDGDGVSDIDELNAGNSPWMAGSAGDGQFCPDITYGCGARIAVHPASGPMSLLGLSAIGLGIIALRRRRGRSLRKRASF